MNNNVLAIQKVKDKKSVIIDGNVHGSLKTHCKDKSLKIGGVIENLINLYLNDPKRIQKLIDEVKDSNE